MLSDITNKSGNCLISRRIRHLKLFVFLLTGFICSSNTSLADDSKSVLSSGCEVDYPPFCIVHEDGRADGFSVELMQAALKKMGCEVKFRTGPWKEVRGWLERGEIDALPLVGRTPEREKLFDFTVPYMTMHGVIVVRKDTEGINSLQDLDGRRVGVMKGDNAEEFLRRKERGIEILTTPTFSEAFYALSESRCDAVVVQRLVANRLLEETGLVNLRIVERPIREFAQDFCFAVKEGDRETLALLNEGLALAVADGTHRRLHSKWFAYLQLPPDRPIIIGGDHNYPPFEFLDENGKPAGFTVDLTRAIAREMNLNITIKLGPWEDIVRGLENGEIDALQGMFYSSERDRKLDFSPHYIMVHYVGVARTTDGNPPESFSELAGRKVAVQSGDMIMELLIEKKIEAQILKVETHEDVLRAVIDGRADCGVVMRLSAMHLIADKDLKGIQLGKTTLYTGQYCYAVPEEKQALLSQLTEGLHILKNSGEYKQLHEKWLGVYEEHFLWEDVLRYMTIIGVPLLLIALLALTWTWGLRRQVAGRTAELRQRLEYEKMLAKVSAMAAETEDLDKFLNDSLSAVGRMLDVSRTYIFLYREETDTFDNTHEWCGEGLIPQKENLQNFPGMMDQFWGKTLNSGKVIAFADIEEIPDPKIKKMLKEQNIISILVVPFFIDGNFTGFIGFDECRRHRNWRQKNIELLETLSRIIASIIQKKTAKDLLKSEMEWSEKIIENAPNIIIGLGEKSKILVFNRYAEKLTGYKFQEVIGKEWIKIFIPEEMRKDIYQVWDEILEKKFIEHHFENEIITKSGQKILVEWTNTVLSEDGKFSMVLSLGIDITEKKAAEKKLWENTEFQRAMIACSPVALYSVDMKGKGLSWNKASERVFGWSEKEVVGKPLPIVPDDKREEFESLRQKIIEGGTFTGKELIRIKKDGTRFPISLSVAPIFDENGQLNGIMGAAVDITERKHQEIHIEHLNRVLRAIRNVNQLITHETDRDELLRRSCEILISMRGYHTAWIAVNDSDGKLVPAAESGIGEDFEAVRQALEKGEFPECYNLARKNQDGIAVIKDRSESCKGCPLASSYRDSTTFAGLLRHDKKEYGLLVVTLPGELTEDKEEQSLFHELIDDIAYALYAMESNRKQHEEETKFRSYFENSPFGIFIADRLGRYVDINPAACRITGYSSRELLDMSIPDLIPPEEKEQALNSFHSAKKDGCSTIEIGFIHKSGEERRWLVSAVALSTDRFLCFTIDITDHRRAEEEQEKLQDQLRQSQKMESIGRLAGGIAHDFNNMLTVIMGYIEMLIPQFSDDDSRRKQLMEVKKAGQRSADLTSQLLAFARKQTVKPVVLDMNEKVSSLLDMLRRLIGEDLDLVWKPGTGLRHVKIDPGQIDQILANLCVNARDAIKDVGKITIETENANIDQSQCRPDSEAVPGNYSVLIVSDDGEGMNAETLNHIFEPFFTTKKTGQGTGLGLATVYGIVKQNKGFINIYSEPGEGTCFRIYLPGVKEDMETENQSAAADTPQKLEGDETILLVEDEPSVREIARSFLEESGYTVIEADHPDKALKLAEENSGNIDFLITDVVMPGMNGRELAEKLLNQQPGLKVLFISGYTANSIVHQGVLDKDVNFLSKPFQREELLRKVRSIIDIIQP